MRDFGAVGDGATMDTTAIQRAIDAAHAAGGGRVTVPSGIYLAGTVHLHSHVELHLEEGAVLKGCMSESGYNRNDAFPENFWSQDEEWKEFGDCPHRPSWLLNIARNIRYCRLLPT